MVLDIKNVVLVCGEKLGIFIVLNVGEINVSVEVILVDGFNKKVWNYILLFCVLIFIKRIFRWLNFVEYCILVLLIEGRNLIGVLSYLE